jgi:hypothetical protein
MAGTANVEEALRTLGWELLHNASDKIMPLGIYTVDDNDDPMSFREALERLRLMAELEEQRELELDQQIAEWRARAA